MVSFGLIKAAPSSIPTSGIQRTNSSSGASGGERSKPGSHKSPPSTPGSASHEELIWAQVAVATDEGDGSSGSLPEATRGRGFSFRRKSSSANDSGESGEDSGVAAALPLVVKRGQIVLLFDGQCKQCLAFCGGMLGRVDRSHLKVLEGSAAPQCPRGDTSDDAKALMSVFVRDGFRLVQHFSRLLAQLGCQ